MSEHECATEIWDAQAVSSMPGSDEVRTIGGHGTGAIAELHPYGRPIDVYRAFTEPPQDNDTPEKRFGRAVEPILLMWAQLELLGEGAELTPGVKTRSQIHPLLHSHPDAVFNGNAKYSAGLVSAKHVGGYSARHWGSSKTDRVPDYAAIQETIYCGQTGHSVSYVVASIGGKAPELWTVPFHQQMFDDLVALDYGFYRHHILPRIPPPPDGSKRYKAWINETIKQKSAELIKVATGDEMHYVVEKYREARVKAHAAAVALELADQTLRKAIGDDAGLELVESKEKITYKANIRGIRSLRVPKSFTSGDEDE